MSNPHSVGALMVVGLTGTTVTTETRRLLMRLQPGGIVLFLRNIESARQLRSFTRELKRAGTDQPIIAVDQEGGSVNRLRYVVGELPTIPELLGRGVSAELFGRVTGRLMRGLGLDMNFAPVLDVEWFDENTNNALRYRCWGRTPVEVARNAGRFLDGLQSTEVAGCAKHFPGLGGARLDSHEELPTIQRQREEMLNQDLMPFRAVLARLKAVMVGHGHYQAFDSDKRLPATLSSRIVTGLLRQQLGFDGLVLTDDMEMGAITRMSRIEDAVLRAVTAGADAVLVCHTTEAMFRAHEALSKAVESGVIGVERLRLARHRWDRVRFP